jgi:bilirubin oxidase
MKQRNLFLILSLITAIFTNAQNPLLIPGTITGTSVNLNLQNGTHEFYEGVSTTTMGVNGDILGPTLILQKGDFVDITVNNQIADTTTIHWHGMHVTGSNDGGPHTTIAPGESWNPSFTVMDKAGTYWYHPHLHTKTNKHVSMGIAGFIFVKDTEEAALNLPRTYGIDDFPLAIQTKDFDDNHQIVVPSNSDDVIMVNATLDPYLEVPAQVVRLHLLNGSSMRVFNIGLTNNRSFYMIASDGGLLSAPLELSRLSLAPGERAELLIDFSGMEGQNFNLMSYAAEFPNGIYGATNPGINSSMILNGYKPNPLNGNNFDIMSFQVVAATGNPITEIPTSLVDVNPIPEENSNIARTLTFSPENMGMNQLNGDFLINGVGFNMDVINYTITEGNIEIWTLKNQSAIAHPFHIHDVQFYVLDRNGNTPPEAEQGRKDVILVKPQETVRFIAQFNDFGGDPVPFMYHCHMLIHEDGGMMGQFKVAASTGIEDQSVKEKLNYSIYPNPAKDFITIVSAKKMAENITIDVVDMNAKAVLTADFQSRASIILNISSLKSGVYSLIIRSYNTQETKKLIVK